jgi:hypothetical protein
LGKYGGTLNVPKNLPNEGCPVPQPKLTNRPSARRMMCRPEAMVNRSTWGLMLTALTALALSHETSISTSKWPMLASQ